MEMRQEKIIHLTWDGKKSLQEVKKMDKEKDKGIYRVYGNHPVYGSNSLIYIGRTIKQTFAERIEQEENGWLKDEDILPSKIIVGRFDPDDNLSDKEKEQVEQMLIYSHSPAYNSSNIGKPLGKEFHELHILNWGIRGSLLPEVSGLRWGNYYDE